jgi:hypothetical protein
MKHSRRKNIFWGLVLYFIPISIVNVLAIDDEFPWGFRADTRYGIEKTIFIKDSIVFQKSTKKIAFNYADFQDFSVVYCYDFLSDREPATYKEFQMLKSNFNNEKLKMNGMQEDSSEYSCRYTIFRNNKKVLELSSGKKISALDHLQNQCLMDTFDIDSWVYENEYVLSILPEELEIYQARLYLLNKYLCSRNSMKHWKEHRLLYEKALCSIEDEKNLNRIKEKEPELSNSYSIIRLFYSDNILVDSLKTNPIIFSKQQFREYYLINTVFDFQQKNSIDSMCFENLYFSQSPYIQKGKDSNIGFYMLYRILKNDTLLTEIGCNCLVHILEDLIIVASYESTFADCLPKIVNLYEFQKCDSKSPWDISNIPWTSFSTLKQPINMYYSDDFFRSIDSMYRSTIEVSSE